MKKLIENDLIKSVLIGLLVATLATVFLTCIFALIITYKPVSLKISGLFATIILVISSFIGGFIASMIKKEKGIIVGGITGFIFYLCIVVLSLSILGSAVTSSLVIKLIVITFSAAIGGIFGVNKGIKNKLI